MKEIDESLLLEVSYIYKNISSKGGMHLYKLMEDDLFPSLKDIFQSCQHSRIIHNFLEFIWEFYTEGENIQGENGFDYNKVFLDMQNSGIIHQIEKIPIENDWVQKLINNIVYRFNCDQNVLLDNVEEENFSF